MKLSTPIPSPKALTLFVGLLVVGIFVLEPALPLRAQHPPQHPPILPPLTPPPTNGPGIAPLPPPPPIPVPGTRLPGPRDPMTTPSGDPLVPERERRPIERPLPAVAVWLSRLDHIDDRLRAGRGRKAGRLVEETIGDILMQGGGENVLRPILAELSLFRALADAQQGLWRRAEWRLHTALNLDPELGERDLSPYGEAGTWLGERPFRLLGVVPEDALTPAFTEPPEPREDGAEAPAIVRGTDPPEAFSRPGSPWRRIQPPHRVEVVVGRWGEVSQPRVLAADLAHPVMVFLVLEALWQAAPFEPARLDGETRDSLYDIDLETSLPWVQRAQARW